MSGDLHLRPATLDDARAVWLWRNEPAARAASRHTAEIPYEAHAAWYPQALQGQTLLIAELDGEPVGVVRLSPGDDGGVVSINLAPEARGRGLGGRVLAAALNGRAGPFRAEVREGNAASLAIFQRCGFVELGRDGAFVRLARDA